MPTVRQFAFSSGEISPALHARADHSRYQTGLRICRNFFVQRFGTLANRPGTRFIAETKDSTKKARLLPFIFNVSQAYILELGDLYIRFYKNASQILSAGVPVEVSAPYTEAQLRDVQVVQNADVMTFVHPSHPIKRLSRLSDTSWTLSDMPLTPQISAPTSIRLSAPAAGTNRFVYHITAIDKTTFEESLAGVATALSLPNPVTSAHRIQWEAVVSAQQYNIYLERDGVPGFIAAAIGTSAFNRGVTPDFTDTPPRNLGVLSAVDDRPSAVTYYQQRQIFAATNKQPENVFASKTALFHNFTVASPVQDDDAVIFGLVGRQVNIIRHLVDLGTLVILTAGGEWVVQGDTAGIMKATAVNAKQEGYIGASRVPPIIVVNTALYVQARGSIVRDLLFNFESDTYSGSDLTLFSSHLFDGKTIEEWAHAQIPHSLTWCVQNDGSLLCLTYVRDHQIVGWTRHDTDGLFESVATIPEDDEDVAYFIVNRTIGGATKRYIERMMTRRIINHESTDAIHVDSSLSFDGRNTGTTTMTLTGGVTWAAGENLTLTASAAYFAASDVGNQIYMIDTDGTTAKCTITVFTSTTVVTVQSDITVPVALRATATKKWAKAVKSFAGLAHLNGKSVAVLGDGTTRHSPNNGSYPVNTVSGGSVTLSVHAAVAHVGLPFICDMETLDIEVGQGETLMDKAKNMGRVVVRVEDTKGIFAGPRPPSSTMSALQNLYSLDIRDEDGNALSAEALKTGIATVAIKSDWNLGGRIFLRQVDPLPAAILAVAPAGYVPVRGS